MKPLNRKNYGSIPHLSCSKLGTGDHFIDKGQERILTEKTRSSKDTVFVFERYDGSNVGIAKKDGNIFAIGRSGYELSTSPYWHHHEFARWVGRNFERFYYLLNDGERIAGEWLLKTHGLQYDISVDPVVFFDYFNEHNKRQPFSKLSEMDIPMPRLLHKGGAVKVEDLLPTLNKKTEHIKSVELPEGMVYRVERQGNVDFLAKWVRSDFEAGKYMKTNMLNNVKNSVWEQN